MDEQSLQGWLEAYGCAWDTRDPRLAAELFSEDATYQETPFVAPLHGRAAIRQYWADKVEKSQENVQFESKVLAVASNLAIAHWWALFVRVKSGKQVRLDGIFLLTFDAGGRCQKLQEWWVRQE